MNASSADFAATTPWTGIQGKPEFLAPTAAAPIPDGALLVWSAISQRWIPLTLAQLKSRLDAL